MRFSVDGLEIRDLVMVLSLKQWQIQCAFEFERSQENRFLVRGFVFWYRRDITWDGHRCPVGVRES